MAKITKLTTPKEDNKKEISDIQEKVEKHINDKSNPHSVTKTQVGLEKVDNTSDKDKSVKYATNAGSATSATTATKATNDGDGNNIAKTYLPLSGGTLTGQLVEQKGHRVHYAEAGSGQSGYIGFAKFTIARQYQDQPIELKIILRGTETPTTVSIRFSAASEKDPKLAMFKCMGAYDEFYMYKLATSVWVLYVKKNSNYDAIDVIDVSKGYYDEGITIKWMDELAEELPDGSIRAAWGYTVGNAKTADTATKATTADSATKVGSSTVGGAYKPVYFNNGTPTPCNASIPTKTSQLENDSNYISGSSPEAPYGNGSGGISVGTGLVNSYSEESYVINCTPDVANTGGTVQTCTYTESYGEELYYYVASEWGWDFGAEYDGKDLLAISGNVVVEAPTFDHSFGELMDNVDHLVVEYDYDTRKSRIRFLGDDDHMLEDYVSGTDVTITVESGTTLLYQSLFGNYNLERSGAESVLPLLMVGNGSSAGARSNALRLTHTSQMYLGTGGKYNATGADYGEYFEWLDGNGNLEDRRGLFVTTKSGKIRIAKEGDFIIGAVSCNASIIGNSDEEWQGRYLKNDFGETLYRLQEENGTVRKVPVENPEYNPKLEYIPRSERPEWDVIGLYGRVRVIDNGLCETGCFATVGEDGTAVPAERGFPVFCRASEKVIEILFSWGISASLQNTK